MCKIGLKKPWIQKNIF